MEIIAVVGLVVMGAILGFCLRGKESCVEHWDYDIKASRVSSLETRIYILESENQRLNHIFNNWQMKKRCFEEEYFAHCHRCNRNFYSKTPDTQKVADMLKTISLTTDNLAEKLDIKID